VRWLFAAVAVIVILAIAAAAAVPWLVDTPRVQAMIAASASQALGRPVKFRSVSVRVLPLPAVELTGLEVAEDPRFGDAPFLKLDRGLLRLRLGPLLAGRVEFGELILKEPRISAIQSADGRWNFASIGAGRDTAPVPRAGGAGPEGRGGSPLALPVLVSRFRIDDGLVTYAAPGAAAARRDYRFEKLDLTVSEKGGEFRFEGSGRLQPGDVGVKIAEGAVALNGVRSLQEAPLRGRVELASKDVGRLVASVAGPALGLAGGLEGALALAGTVGSPAASGEIALPQVKVSRRDPKCGKPEERVLAVSSLKMPVDWQGGRLTIRPLTADVAGGTVSTVVAVALGGAGRVELGDLGVKGLPLERVLVDFLCQGYAVSGPLDLTGRLAFRQADPLATLSGDGRLAIGRGKVVGSQALALLSSIAQVGGALSAVLGSGPGAVASLSDFDSITGTFRIDSGVATSRDLRLAGRAVSIGVAGSYALVSGRVDADVSVRHAAGEVQARVTGTAASPRIQLKPASVLRDVDPQKVQRSLQDLLKRFR
jgi:uncharacterized protein involved in outer membrane biogenesis